MIECLYLGKGKEAVNVSLYALSLDSSNAGLIGNLALSYLIKGERELADKTIKRAILAEPSDIINLKLEQIINDVIIGKRKRPTKYDEIQF
jgi:Flp pilus assembly protein TadD